jgi:carboxymethylenebutenolidase
MTTEENKLVALWEKHMESEFVSKDVDETMDTMVENCYVNHVPVRTGGVGAIAVKDFYSRFFIPTMPEDTKTIPISRTVGRDQIVDEMIFSCTHSKKMDWFLPGVEPTGKYVEVPLVAIIKFVFMEDEETKETIPKVISEHIYWDQASVLVQIGLLDPTGLPVDGIQSSHKVVDARGIPSRQLP